MDLDERVDGIAALMEARLGIRGDGFEAKFRRAGRRLPRRLRREAALLVDARARAGHPKLERQIDEARLESAARALERHLDGLDGMERRMTLAIHWLAGNVFNLMIVIALALVVMAWRGLI